MVFYHNQNRFQRSFSDTKAFNAIRELVSREKRRFVDEGYNLDLSCKLNHFLFAFAYPASSDGESEAPFSCQSSFIRASINRKHFDKHSHRASVLETTRRTFACSLLPFAFPSVMTLPQLMIELFVCRHWTSSGGHGIPFEGIRR